MAYKEPVKIFKLRKDPTWVEGSELPQHLSVFEATQPNVIPNGEFGFNKAGLVVLKNNTGSLYSVLSNILNALTLISVSLATNPTTEPAAAASAVILAASVIELQTEINTLLAPPGTEEI